MGPPGRELEKRGRRGCSPPRASREGLNAPWLAYPGSLNRPFPTSVSACRGNVPRHHRDMSHRRAEHQSGERRGRSHPARRGPASPPPPISPWNASRVRCRSGPNTGTIGGRSRCRRRTSSIARSSCASTPFATFLRHVLHHDVRIDAVILDGPAPGRLPPRVFRLRHRAAVDEQLVAADADDAAPRTLPMTGASFSLWIAAGKMSPSEPANSLVSTTKGPFTAM